MKQLVLALGALVALAPVMAAAAEPNDHHAGMHAMGHHHHHHHGGWHHGWRRHHHHPVPGHDMGNHRDTGDHHP